MNAKSGRCDSYRGQVLILKCAFYMHEVESKQVYTLRRFICRGFPYETSTTCKR